MTRGTSSIDRDPWDALIAADEAATQLLDVSPHLDSRAHPVTVVIGAAGGVGTTLVACGLALATAAGGIPVALAEFDLERGDISGAWGVPPERTIDDLTSVIDELMPSHVEMVCHPHGSGVWLLLAPRRASASTWWDEGAAQLLLRSARMLGQLVVDAGPSLGAHVQAACGQADRVVLVAAPTVAGGRRTRAVLDVLDTWAATPDRCLVVNRAVGHDRLSARQFGRLVGCPVAAELPESRAEAHELDAGRWIPARRGNGLTGAIRQLARVGRSE